MGRYATSASITLLMPNILTGNTTTSDSYGTDIWSNACDSVEGYVNSTITNRYDPSTWTSTGSPPVPPLIRKISEDLTCLYFMRRVMTQDSQIKNPNIAEWEKSEQMLFDIRDGTVKLAYTDGSLVPTRSSSRFLTSTEGFNHLFGIDSEKSWGTGSIQQDAIRLERQLGGSPVSTENDANI